MEEELPSGGKPGAYATGPVIKFKLGQQVRKLIKYFLIFDKFWRISYITIRSFKMSKNNLHVSFRN